MRTSVVSLLTVLMTTGCIKYKKTYSVGEDSGASVDSGSSDPTDTGASDTSTDTTTADGTMTDGTTDGTTTTALTGSYLASIESSMQGKVWSGDTNLNGIHRKARKVEIKNATMTILVEGLQNITSGHMRVEVSDEKGVLQFATLLSNVNVSTNKEFKISLTKCTFKAKTGEAKEAICNWASDQAIN
ncbi:MAG: hypothetical protein H7249_07260 [Chitinophagaceae bacterium]|nr:hypothetical protein [Oligoflexus sp.]